MAIEDGIQKPAEKGETIEREREVGEILQEFNGFFSPGLNVLPSMEEIAKGEKVAEMWIKPFANHPGGVEWLKRFLEETKELMKTALPEGVGVDVFTDKQKRADFVEKNAGTPRMKLVGLVVVDMRDRLFEKKG